MRREKTEYKEVTTYDIYCDKCGDKIEPSLDVMCEMIFITGEKMYSADICPGCATILFTSTLPKLGIDINNE